MGRTSTDMAKKDIKEVQFNFQLRNIELLGVAISAADRPADLGMQVLFQIAMEHRIDLTNKMVVVLTHVNVVSKDDSPIVYGNLITSCNFHVEEMEDYLDKEAGIVNFPEQVVVTLNSIAISTTRGIMYSEFRGTHLHGAVLPMVDPKQFAKPEKAG